jgi:hypothetical protein
MPHWTSPHPCRPPRSRSPEGSWRPLARTFPPRSRTMWRAPPPNPRYASLPCSLSPQVGVSDYSPLCRAPPLEGRESGNLELRRAVNNVTTGTGVGALYRRRIGHICRFCKMFPRSSDSSLTRSCTTSFTALLEARWAGYMSLTPTLASWITLARRTPCFSFLCR